ncbi:DMT family transporter [Candidatus Woesearchaeota archaeon]|nr:DMT family transporter [Candidatus Woesearchaeota archaeon]
MNKGLTLVLFTALISGFSIFINSFGVRGFDSSVFTFSKNILVAVLLFAIILGFKEFSQLKSLKKKQWWQLASIGLIGGSIPFLLFFKGLQLSTGTTSAFIHKTLFVFVAIFAIIFLKEKLSKGIFIGGAFLLLGNYFLIRPDFNLSLGHVLILLATLFWAAEYTLSKYVLKDLSGTTVAFGRMFFGSVFIFAFLLATGKASLVSSMSAAQYGWIALTSVFLLLYVFTFYNGLKNVNVTTATSILLLGSPITTALAWAFRGGAVSLLQALGMLLIVTGIVFIVWYNKIISYGTPAHEGY